MLRMTHWQVVSSGAALALAAMVSLPVMHAQIPPVQFRTPPAFAVGGNPWQVVSADLNGDGLEDLATANFMAGTVSVLLGQGNGRFGPAAHFPAGTGPNSLAVADVNGDSRLDIVTANAEGWSGPGSVSVLLGVGDGTFGAPTNTTVGQGPRGVVVADFNGDSLLDLATAISGGWRDTNQVHVLLGRGDGSFDEPSSYAVGWAPNWIATGDFNGDERPDLVTTDNGGGSMGTTVSVLLNQGDGTFGTATNFTVGSYPNHVVVADFNGDSQADLAVANSYGVSPSVSLLLGQGDGAFGAASHYPIFNGAARLAEGDFNGDGRRDLAVLGGNSDSGVVSVLLGDGAGSFGPATPHNIGTGLKSLCVSDFNRDTRLDIVVAGDYDDTVLFMSGRGDGTFANATDSYRVGGNIQGIITADFNRDAAGLLDIATVSMDAGAISVLLQTNGIFHLASNYYVGTQPHAVKAGDFNNDGRLDLVTANFDGTLTLLRGRSTAPGAFAMTWPVLAIGSNHTDVAVGHFDGGNNLDLVTPNYYGASLSVALGNGNGTFQTGAYLNVNSGPRCVIVADFNTDGNADIAVGYDGGYVITVLFGGGDGSFSTRTNVDTWEIPAYLATGDFNFDGLPDVVAAHYDWRDISVMINRGEGRFDPPVRHEVANDPVTVAVADFNGDNRADIVSGNYASVSVLLGLGDGTFSTATNHFLGGRHVATGDFNQDGMPDIALDLGGQVGIFWNETVPRMEISPAGAADVRLAWPAWQGLQLETSTAGLESDSWRPANLPTVTYGSQLVATNTASSGIQLFRLSKP